MGWIGAILSVLGTGYSAYQQEMDRREAKKAMEKQRSQDAWDQLLSAAGGFQPPRQAPAQALPHGADYGAVARSLGGAMMDYTSQQQQQTQQQQEQATVQRMKDQQAAEVARHNMATEGIDRDRVNRMGSAQKDFMPPASWGSGGGSGRADVKDQLIGKLMGLAPEAAQAPKQDEILKKQVYDMEAIKRMAPAAWSKKDDQDLEMLRMRLKELTRADRYNPAGLKSEF